MTSRLSAEIEQDMREAELKAWQNLARYKFWGFGYWAAIWVHLNRVGHFKRPNPFAVLVKMAREIVAARAPAQQPAALPLLQEDAA